MPKTFGIGNPKHVAKRGQRYCLDCGVPFRNSDYTSGSVCKGCREKKATVGVVFDRKKGVGEIPANLRERYGI